jgi:DNA-binding transcriptional ArsR family regulator
MKPTASTRRLIEKSGEVAALFGGLSHPVRLQILCCLMESQKGGGAGERSVSELTGFCEISQPEMSQFLSRMKKENLVQSRRDGNRVLYSIADPNLASLLQTVKDLYCS